MYIIIIMYSLEGHHIMIKDSIYQELLTILNLYAPNKVSSK